MIDHDLDLSSLSMMGLDGQVVMRLPPIPPSFTMEIAERFSVPLQELTGPPLAPIVLGDLIAHIDGQRETIHARLAMFHHAKGDFSGVYRAPDDLAGELDAAGTERLNAWKPGEGWERRSEWLDVQFPKLPPHQLAAAALERMQKDEAETMKKLLELQLARQRLLSQEYSLPDPNKDAERLRYEVTSAFAAAAQVPAHLLAGAIAEVSDSDAEGPF